VDVLALRQLDGAAVVDVCELWEYEGQFLKFGFNHGEAFANGDLKPGGIPGGPAVMVIDREEEKSIVRNLWRCE
jgi:hypothetical protein